MNILSVAQLARKALRSSARRPTLPIAAAIAVLRAPCGCGHHGHQRARLIMLRLRGGGVKISTRCSRPSCQPTRTPQHSAHWPTRHFEANYPVLLLLTAWALIQQLCTPELEWVVGGQYQELFMHVESFVKAFAAFGLKLVVFIDGGVDDKLAEWQGRRVKDLPKGRQGRRGASSLRGAAARRGCRLQTSQRPSAAHLRSTAVRSIIRPAADRELAVYRQGLRFLHFAGRDVSQSRHAAAVPRAVYRRAAVEDALSLPSPLLPLLGSLVGNDFVPTALLERYHQHLLPGRHATGSQLIDAVASGWRGWMARPRPMTPLLWCALDWGGRLSDDARSLVERSLEQYAVEDGFEELPAALLERASGVSSAMLKRFRRGGDATVFTAATRLAIWRGLVSTILMRRRRYLRAGRFDARCTRHASRLLALQLLLWCPSM